MSEIKKRLLRKEISKVRITKMKYLVLILPTKFQKQTIKIEDQ